MAVTVPRHHAEWLSLVETSGPFLSLSVLLSVFPQGLDAHDPAVAARLRLAHAEWSAAIESGDPDPAVHRAWVVFVLREILEFPPETLVEGQGIPEALKAVVAEHGETIRPTFAAVDPEKRTPRLLVMVVSPDQGLERPLAGTRWKASPATRMTELLRAANIRLGLVTNGEHWMLVNAPRGGTSGFASWHAALLIEEPLTLRAFRSLLGVGRFFGVAESDTIEELLARGTEDQREVTDQLGYQVRKAVEVLVQTLDRIDKDRDREFLAGMTEADIYGAALTVMMRLVFLFSAEERGLLLLGDPLYDQFYAVSTLREQLRERADAVGEEVLERRADAWARLLAVFRAVHAGVRHDSFQLPAHGGSLFDPDRLPFLEGRQAGTSWRDTPARPIPVDNRTVLHLLEALQVLTVKVPGGGAEPRRLSFRALDVEQIGHVYEGLLDHTAVRAETPVLGLAGTRDKEPEIPLERLETLRTGDESELVAFLKTETGRSPAALAKALNHEPTPPEIERFHAACENDEDLWRRVRPFAGLVRRDMSEHPVVIPTGSVFVTKGTDRRATGTHYTPRSLTEEIVLHALEPLVYDGPADGKPRDAWRLKSAKDLLELKICDFAMGSGAFLVQACRYLAERLVEAWDAAEREHPGCVVTTPEGAVSSGESSEPLLPRDAEERLTVARRVVADRCLYGVDINPTAVEMAKLSLWLVTVQKNRPFTFLDHALRSGDSLLGVTTLKQIEFLSLHPDEAGQMPLVAEGFQGWLREALAKRLEIETLPDNDVADVERKQHLLADADAALDNVRFIADLLVGQELHGIGRPRSDFAAELQVLSAEIAETLGMTDSDRRVRVSALRGKAERLLSGRRPFHWPLEFPEVFTSKPNGDSGKVGFDALVGNPPFMGGQKITGELGTDYREFLVEHLAGGQRGSADLCAYFFLRAEDLLKRGGNFGLVATNTIAQGDTREVGLDQLAASGTTIYRAVPSRPWPGAAALEVAYVWTHRGDGWKGGYVLDEKTVEGITPFLTEPSKATGNPHRLKVNENKSFQGSIVLGMGFVLTPEETEGLIARNPKNKDVLFPYLNGEDLNSRYDQSPSRWVINFRDWPLDGEHDNPNKPKGPPYAADYPDCLEIVIEKVKPQRVSQNDEGGRLFWWRFLRTRPELYTAISGMERVLVIALTSKTASPTFVSTAQVLDQSTIVFAIESVKIFTLLASSIHYFWIILLGTPLKTDARYSVTQCFETFPFPASTEGLEEIGERYYTHRQAIMTERQEGLTKTYNRFHNPKETSADIVQLRRLHVEMDAAVAAAYGWTDLELGHGFHETKQGTRYTISEPARREVLDRLLELNHQRYAEEVAAGLHDKPKKPQGKAARKSAKNAETAKQGGLFD